MTSPTTAARSTRKSSRRCRCRYPASTTYPTRATSSTASIRSRKAEKAAEQRRERERQAQLAQPKLTLDTMFTQIAEQDLKEILVVLKADVQGSVDVLKNEIEKISRRGCQGPRDPLGNGGHHRIGHPARRRVAGGHHRVQRHRQRQGAFARRDEGRGDPQLPGDLPHRRGHEEGRRGYAGPGDSARKCWVTPRSARCSRSPRSARSPDAMSPTVRSSATRSSASRATAWSSRTTASSSSSNASRTMSKEVTLGHGVRHEDHRLRRHQGR